jgi:hypothetical protein
MDREKIKDEFLRKAETIIEMKIKYIDSKTGHDLVIAKQEHLDGFEEFCAELNILINKTLEGNNVEFKSVEESNKFADYIQPIFNELYSKFIELAKL